MNLEKLYTPTQCFNNIRWHYFNNRDGLNYELEQFWFDKIKKSLKALEIIKEKKVDIKDLINEFDWSDGLKSYNERTNHQSLTQEEYDLLTEILL